MEIRHTRGQFLATWAIFGFILCFAIQEFIGFLNELIIAGGIYADIAPPVLKYSKAFCYFLLWIAILLFLVIVIRSKGPVFSHFNYKRSRVAVVIFIVVAIASHVLAQYLIKARRPTLRPYLTRHDSTMVEFISSNYVITLIPFILIFITIAVGFYLLTREPEGEEIF